MILERSAAEALSQLVEREMQDAWWRGQLPSEIAQSILAVWREHFPLALWTAHDHPPYVRVEGLWNRL